MLFLTRVIHSFPLAKRLGELFGTAGRVKPSLPVRVPELKGVGAARKTEENRRRSMAKNATSWIEVLILSLGPKSEIMS